MHADWGVSGVEGEEAVAKGKALANSGRHAEALPLLEEAVRLDTSNGNAWQFLGVTLANLQRYADVLAANEHAL